MASCNDNALLAAAAQYGSLWGLLSRGLAMELMVKIAQLVGSPATDMPTLISQGKCFECYGPLEIAAMRAVLWRDFAEANGATPSNNPVTLAGSNPCAMMQGGEALTLTYLVSLYSISTTTESLADLLTQAKCYLCYSASEITVAEMVLLQVMNGNTETPQQLLTRAGCFLCLTLPQINTVIVDLIRLVPGGDTPPPPFSPSDIPGMVLWLKPESIVGTPLDPFPVWPDSSGNGNDASTFGSPPVIAGALYNGNRAVTFDNSGLAPSNSLFSGNQSRAVFVVFLSSIGASPFVGHICGTDNGAPAADIWWVIYTTDFSGEPFGSTGGNDAPGIEGQGTSMLAACFRYDGAGGEPTITSSTNGFGFTDSLAVAAAQNTIGDPFSIGIDSASTFPFFGDIAEVIVYQGNLSNTDTTNVLTYLTTKFGLIP